MNRKTFIKQCAFACVSGAVATALLEGCATAKTISGTLISDYISLPCSTFETKNAGTPFRKYVIVQHDALQYPVCLFRFSESDYTALWMQCSHQGAELQVFGDKLQCPAHGSEFDNRGMVQNGPAENHLRAFPVTINNDQIQISLKK